MNTIRSWSLLRQVLLVDAVSSGALGIGLIVLAEVLADLLQLPASMLAEAGVVLIPFAAFVAWLATRERPGRRAVWTVIGLNVFWAVDSVVLLFTGWVAPNALGYGFIIGQALVVGLYAELEYVGLRKEALAAA